MSTFIPNPALLSELESSAGMKDALKEAAEAGASEARRIAPVDTGDYQDSIHVEEGDGVQLVADVPYAIYVELGTEDTPAFQPLRRGLEAAGLKLEGR